MSKKNRLEYEHVGGFGGGHLKWTLHYEGMVFEGTAQTVREVYRRANRTLRRYKRFEKKLRRREG